MLWMCFLDYWTYDKLLLNIKEIFRYWVLNENLGEGRKGEDQTVGWGGCVAQSADDLGESFGQVLVIYGHFEGCHMCIRADLLHLK